MKIWCHIQQLFRVSRTWSQYLCTYLENGGLLIVRPIFLSSRIVATRLFAKWFPFFSKACAPVVIGVSGVSPIHSPPLHPLHLQFCQSSHAKKLRSLFLSYFWTKIWSDNCFETILTSKMALEGLHNFRLSKKTCFSDFSQIGPILFHGPIWMKSLQ